MKEPGQQFDSVLDYREQLWIGNNMYNNLIVCFRETFSVNDLIYFGIRAVKIEANYPQLKYVMIFDKGYSEPFNKEMRCIYLENYKSPQDVVKDLEKITVDPKKCVMPVIGEGI